MTELAVAGAKISVVAPQCWGKIVQKRGESSADQETEVLAPPHWASPVPCVIDREPFLFASAIPHCRSLNCNRPNFYSMDPQGEVKVCRLLGRAASESGRSRSAERGGRHPGPRQVRSRVGRLLTATGSGRKTFAPSTPLQQDAPVLAGFVSA
jgi:hypothetical protein